MSQDFRKVLVLDDRLRVKSDVDFAVFKGASSKVESEFQSTSASASQVSFNIQVPSELTIIDREVILQGTVRLQVVGVAQAGEYLVDYGNGHALCPFPLQSLFTTSQATINNNSVSQNTADVISSITRFHDRRYLARYNGMTPTAYDTYQNYSDAVNANNNPNGSYNNPTDNDLMPRGAFPVSITGNTIGDGVSTKTVVITYTVREPLLLSPFLYCDPEKENQGFYGIQNLNFIFNIGNVQNILRGVNNSVAGCAFQLLNVANSDFLMYMNFLTAPNSVLLPPRNVVPYYELPRYKTTIPDVATGATATVPSQSIQLNQVPDKLIIFVRKQNRTFSDTDSYLPINSISINFNNVSGLLSSSRQHDLWKMSVKSGSNQSWLEFSGQANSHTGAYAGNAQPINTSGSLLVLDFAREVPLSEEYYAPSSLGQFQLQFQLNVSNNTGANINSGNPYELVIITMNSGVFVCERGTSATYTAVLTKQDVLDASQDESARMSYSSARRLIGGKVDVMGMLKGALPTGAKVAKALLEQSSNPYAKTAVKVLGALGYGYEGDGRSGGGVGLGHSGGGVGLGRSGGRMASHLM